MTRVSVWVTILFFFVIGSATFGWILNSPETLFGPPSLMGDDVHFENLGFHLARNEGFMLDFTVPEWRQPYFETYTDSETKWLLFLNQKGLTTSRAPGFPFIVSIVYRVCGRQFFVVRLLNWLLLTSSIAIMLSLICRYHGYIAGSLALLTLSLDLFVLRTPGQFMTEATGTAIVCALFSACIWVGNQPQLSSRGKILTWLSIGILFGIGTLVRANLNAWFLILFVLWVAITGKQLVAGKSYQALLRYGVCFFFGVLLAASPWWIRNCQITGGFTPFGTSGSFGMVGGYSDEAYGNFGNWLNDAPYRLEDECKSKPGFLELPLAEQEYRMGQTSTAQAKQWMLENWQKLPALMSMKAVSHLGFHRQPPLLLWINGLLLFGTLIGCFANRTSTGFWVALIIGLSVVTTSLTWAHYGRYSIPIRPLIHVASAIGTVAFWSWVLRFVKPRSS